jgi:hypothetical protein
MARGESSASRIARSVISWKTIREMGMRGLSVSTRCQPMLSPSRSSSVATTSSSASLRSFRSSATTFFLLEGTT